MAKHIDLSKEDVLHIAKLANLPISEENLKMYQKQLSETIHYVENLDELKTKDVKSTSHSTDLTDVYFEDGAENEKGFTQEEALKNAKKTKKKMFVVKRIME